MKYTSRCSGFSCTRVALIMSTETDRYSCKGSSSTGRLIIGVLLIITFICWNASSHRSSHLFTVCFFVILRISLILYVNLGKKRASDIKWPTNRWISLRFLGLLISAMAVHLSGLASIPRAVSIKPRNFPIGTPNTHFSGLRRILYLRTWWKTSLRSQTWSSTVFYHHVVHIHLHDPTYLPFEDAIHELLVRRSGVL